LAMVTILQGVGVEQFTVIGEVVMLVVVASTHQRHSGRNRTLGSVKPEKFC